MPKLKEVKCPKCLERGGVRARKDAYADHKIFTNGDWEHDTTAVMDDTQAYECFSSGCNEELTPKEIQRANPEFDLNLPKVRKH